MKGSRGEVCGMEREAANMRSVCFSSGFGFHPSLSSVIVSFFSFHHFAFDMLVSL